MSKNNRPRTTSRTAYILVEQEKERTKQNRCRPVKIGCRCIFLISPAPEIRRVRHIATMTWQSAGKYSGLSPQPGGAAPASSQGRPPVTSVSECFSELQQRPCVGLSPSFHDLRPFCFSWLDYSTAPPQKQGQVQKSTPKAELSKQAAVLCEIFINFFDRNFL